MASAQERRPLPEAGEGAKPLGRLTFALVCAFAASACALFAVALLQSVIALAEPPMA